MTAKSKSSRSQESTESDWKTRLKDATQQSRVTQYGRFLDQVAQIPDGMNVQYTAHLTAKQMTVLRELAKEGMKIQQLIREGVDLVIQKYVATK